MSTMTNVQGAIAQAKLNRRVFRDLNSAYKDMLPLWSEEEVESFIKENGLTLEQLIEEMQSFLQIAVDSALVKIKEKQQKDLENYLKKRQRADKK